MASLQNMDFGEWTGLEIFRPNHRATFTMASPKSPS